MATVPRARSFGPAVGYIVPRAKNEPKGSIFGHVLIRNIYYGNGSIRVGVPGEFLLLLLLQGTEVLVGTVLIGDAGTGRGNGTTDRTLPIAEKNHFHLFSRERCSRVQ
ncbi:delta-1-pyrroline-5-carboxylate dehydrogenase PrnC [Anopheles sinensis]|uniref:Delta-1-pyrroline-5-carboxylate dehydrogenase PrnC n=1 Tax=Anopheles sinensis TaxID=74873 RepID=A0A084WBN2_ANOSI|nr:delta-1-pyrroline-5-carboxylate dehydrogenase PrnC [Anopheles sinensis]